jgi:hypothetical protein
MKTPFKENARVLDIKNSDHSALKACSEVHASRMPTDAGTSVLCWEGELVHLVLLLQFPKPNSAILAQSEKHA